MRIPTIKGIIDRRMLVNFRIDAEIAKTIVPAPFSPKIYKGMAIAGICLIRLKQIRIKGLPAFFGVRSENGAHCIAVEWQEDGQIKDGVYIPRGIAHLYLTTLQVGGCFPASITVLSLM
jgi:hypothetical protein